MKGWTYSTHGKRISVPRYFREKLEIEVPDTDIRFTEDFRRETEHLFDEFYCRYPQLRNSPDQAARMFEYWYDSAKWTLHQKIMEDYEERNRLFHGGV